LTATHTALRTNNFTVQNF